MENKTTDIKKKEVIFSVSKENISLTQLFAIILGFNLGNSLVLGIGLNGKMDAWIVVGISSILGTVIALFYYYINELIPNKNLYQLLEYCFNRKIAILFSYIYLIYFFYLACRVLRDFSELTATAILPSTPLEFTTLVLVLVIGYILYLGIEVLGRTTEIFTPYAIGFLILLTIFLYGNNSLDINNIKPVFATSIKDFAKIIFPYELVRPYGQMIAFTCIFSKLSNFKFGKRVVFASLGFSGFFLILATILITLSLGSNIATEATFPLLSTARLVSISEFIERIDLFAVFIIMLGILVKSSIFMYAGMLGLEYIHQIPYRYFSIPIACIITMFTVFIGDDITDHVFEGFMVIPYLINIPLQFVLPCFLIVMMLIKRRKKNLLINEQ